MFKRLGKTSGAVEVALLIWMGLAVIGITYSLMPRQRVDHQFDKAVDVCVGEAIQIRPMIDENGNEISSLVDEVNNRIDEVRAADPGIRDACIVEVSEMSEDERLEYIRDI